jgi:PIN domain nuclease of toxin-antitoxin system
VTLLLDTHAFSWFCQDDPLLSSTAKALIEDAGNRRLLSVASSLDLILDGYGVSRLW